ncbi:Tat pathway signal sequence domain protein [Streptomyces sp. NPDC088387]|uniref:Tat pathway signal sequence domain protein n=1 Tax=Streptomyces sp. NPDC088387 TaxID=3365859 RepID=UPI0037F7F188
MSGVGPVEPGEGTHQWEAPPERGPAHGPAGRLRPRQRRRILAGAAATGLVIAAGYLYATRPEPPPAPEPPYPSQVVGLHYTGTHDTAARAGSFVFSVDVTARSGPDVTVVRIGQPYAGLSLTSIPRAPFRTTTGIPRKITISMKVTDCGKVPRNVVLPFLDVTLRNARAIEAHSFILGEHYAQDLADALQVACGNEFATSPNS